MPETHPLESWGDARSFDGTVTLMQPLIEPLYEGRSPHEFLGAFTAAARIGAAWRSSRTSGRRPTAAAPAAGRSRIRAARRFANADAFWRAALHDGFIAGTSLTEGAPGTTLTPASAPAPAAAAAGAAAAARPPQPRSAAREHGSRPDAPTPQPPAPAPAPPRPLRPRAASKSSSVPIPTIWDGRFANNGWLQELPKPYTKVTWDPAAWISTRLAEERGLREGDVVELRYRGNTVRMPVFVVPGHPAQSVTVFFGYGRSSAGRVGNAVGASQQFNAFLLRTSDAPVVRQRPRAREDRRQLSAGDHAGAPRDGGPRAGPHRDARASTRKTRRSSTSRGTPRRAR